MINEKSWARWRDLATLNRMKNDSSSSGYHPAYEMLTGVLLRMSEQRTVQGVVDAVCEELVATRPHLVRMGCWLCDHHGNYLRLASSRRRSGEPNRPEWAHASGDFTLVPFDEPIIGQVFASSRPVSVPDEDGWPDYPDWARQEGIVSYFASPVRYRGEIFGVNAGFAAHRFREEDRQITLEWTRVFADHCGAMIANTRAFEEIDSLRHRLELENEYLREQDSSARGFGEIVGASAALQQALEQVKLVAPTDANVIIYGESGTGKELIARAVHESSNRCDGPLIRVNCAAIPHELFESEFFGHVKGAFTGAAIDRAGRFELADGGTLFLDEVGEIPIDLQGKLLRVLQEGTLERVGEEKTRRINVRIIAATNRDLRGEIDVGRFRQDLYYRLSVFPVELPPLRKRREDIPLLADQFVRVASRRFGRRAVIHDEHMKQLCDYHWPGNIRELRNVIERAVIISLDGILRFDGLAGSEESAGSEWSEPVVQPNDSVLTYDALRDLEQQNLERALARAAGKIAGPGGAAELLGVKPTTLNSKLKAFGIRRSTK